MKNPAPYLIGNIRRPLDRMVRVAGLTLAFSALPLGAVTLDWDPSGVGTLGGAGTWDNLVASNWWNGATTTWDNSLNDTARFGGTVGTGLVGIDPAGVTAGGLIFATGGYTITGGGGDVTLAGAAPSISVTNLADTATINAKLLGTTGLATGGAGTLVLGGANGFSGGVAVNGGTLSVSADNNLGAGANGVTIDGGTLAISAGFASARTVTLGAGGGSVSVGASQVFTLSSALTATTDALTKAGNGTLTLGAASTRTGTTEVDAGVLSVTNLAALGTGAVDIASTATLELNAGAGTWVPTLNLNGGTLSHAGAGTLTLGTAGQLNATAASILNVTQTGPGGKILLSAPGVLTGSGNIQKTGAGTLQFTSPNTGYTGALRVSGGQTEIQNLQALGTTPAAITVDGTGEVVVTNNTWTGAITANGGAISGNSGNSTYSGAITAGGNFAARARDFNATGTGRTLTLSGPISGSGNLIASGPTAGTGRVILSGSSAGWTGGLQVDANTQAVASVGFGAGSTTSVGTGDLTLNGGRLTLTPSIGTGLTTTAGVSGRWITNPASVTDTFATPWHTQPTLATRIDAALNVPNQATIDPITGLPGAAGGGLNLTVPKGVGLAPAAAFIDRYAVTYNGLLNILAGGSYTFTMASDDGASLFIDGQQIVQTEGSHGLGAPINSGTLNLSAGAHQITVKNTNGGTGGGLQVAYQGLDQPVAPTTGAGITNMATVGLPASALSNVTGGLTYAMTNNIVAPNQGAATTSILETSGFDTTSAGTLTVGTNATINFASATGHAFTQNGAVSLDAGAGLASQNTAVIVPITTTLTSAKTTIAGGVTLLGNANLNADATGLLTVNGAITDGAGTFTITKNAGAGTVVLGGTTANTFDGAFNMGQGLLLLNKTAGVDAIGAGGLNLDTSIATGGAAVDYAVVRLMANEQISDTSTLNVLTHNTVGYGATLDLNGFTETVGAVNVRGGTANMGRIVTGAGGKLVLGGNLTFDNNRNATGNTNREALITGTSATSNALNFFAPGVGTLDLGGATRTITTNSSVTQADTGATIDTIITNGGIVKAGGQRLVLNGSNPTAGANSTFSGGVTLNDGVLRGGGLGAQTDSAFGTGTLTINKGLTTASGGIAAGAATLELRNNGVGANVAIGGTVGVVFPGQSVNNRVTYGNNVTVAGTVPIFGVDVNNYPQSVFSPTFGVNNTITGSGVQLRMGTLTTTAPLQLNVTGGNNYSLGFNGLSLGGALSVNATTGNLQLDNLSGANNIATIAGSTGNLIIGGNGSGFSGNVSVAAAGTLRLAPTVGAANNLFGTGTFTTAANPTIGISAVGVGGTFAAGTPGGLTARFYQMSASGALNTTNFGQVPSGVITVPLLSDGAITNRPPTVTGTSFAQGIVVYSGLLNITNGGEYTFQSYVDDQSQLVIDGKPVVAVNTGGGGSGVVHAPVSAPITLSAGLHTIAFKALNGGGGGGVGVSFSGPDSGSVMRPIPSTALQSVAPLTNVANSGINQSIAAAGSLTLDGGGSDLDGGINNLTFAGATGTLNVTNVGGIGTMTVSGTTAVGANTAALNPTTGALGLIGDVTGGGVINKTGGGLLILSGAKTFSGAININAGGIQITDPASLGTAAGATVVATGAVLDLNGVALGAEPLTLNGTGIAAGTGISGTPAALWNSASSAASASGPITIGVATAIGGLGDITLTGAQSGNFTLQKVGPDTLTLSGASSNTANYTVSAGFLKVNNAAALGTTAGTTNVAGGGVLDLNGFSLAEPLNLTGAGTTNYGTMNSLGSLINTGATVTHSGNVVLGGAASIGSNSLGAGGDITISGIISAGQPLTKVGGNTLTLTGANTYTGATTVNLGTLNVSGATGTIATTSGLTVNPTATVNIDYTAAAAAKITKPITLVGGSLNLLANAAGATTEGIGGNALTFNSNRGILTLNPNTTGSMTLNSTIGTNGFARANNGTALVRGNNLGANAAGTANSANLTFTGAGHTPQTIGQFGADGSANRAILPWAVVDQTNTGDGSSFAKIGVNGIAPLAAADYQLNAISGPNNIRNDSGVIAAPAGSTLVNSISFAPGAGGITLGAGGTLQLDSGAIGAFGVSTSITGGTLNAGVTSSNNLRELVVMTTGAGTNLTVGSVIASSLPGLNVFGPNASPNFVSRVGLIKDGLGTLTLQAQNTYIGTTRINGGTVVLDGGENRILFQVPTAPVQGTLNGTLNAANLVVNAGGTLDLNGNNQRVGGYASNLAAGSSALPGQGGVITNNSTATDSTFYFTMGASFTVPSSINHSAVVGAKNLNVVREGGNTLTLTAPNTYQGTTTILGGLTVLQDGATLSGTSALTINRAALRIDDSQTIQTLNRIPNTIPITLNGGAMTFIGRGGGTQNAYNVGNGVGGSVTIGSGPALLQAQEVGAANANSSGTNQVNVGNIIRAAGSGTLSFNFIQSNAQNMGDNPRFFVDKLNGVAPVATGAMLPAWVTLGGFNPASAQGGTSGSINSIQANTTDFAQYDPATGLRPVFYTSTFAPGNNVNLGQTTTLPIGDTVINSLRFDGASTLIYGNAGYDTLNLQSGGLLSPFNANNRTIGTERNAGRLTAGGVNPGAAQELFVYNSANTLTINSSIINNPDGSAVSLVLGGASLGGTISLNGTNTYTGSTTVNGVNLTLNNTVGVAIPGSITLNGGTNNGADSQAPGAQTLTFAANLSNQIAPTATVTLNGGTGLNLNGGSQTLSALVFATDGGSNNNQGPTVSTGAGTLTLTNGITATDLRQASTIPVIQGNLSLPAGAHGIAVGTFPAAPGAVGFVLNSTLSGAGTISKTGNGILGIGGTSPAYTSTVNVANGQVQFTTNNASLGSTIDLAGGTALSAGGFLGSIGALTGTGTVTSTFGTLAQAGGQVNVGLGGLSTNFGGLVTGVVTMGKVGAGDLTLTNSLNDYTGGTLVNGGTLTLAGAGISATGTGLVTVNNTGTIQGSGVVTGGLRFNGGSAAAFALTTPGGPAPIVTPASVLSRGSSVFNITGTTGLGTYPLIDYAGSAVTASAIAGIRLGTTPGGGFVYGLVNNAAGTSLDLSVEALGASSTWTGAVSGAGDAAGNWTGGSPNGLQVTLNDSGKNKIITGAAITPQAITVSNTICNDYSIGNNIGGAVAGGISKTGNGVLQLTGANTFTGPSSVTGGTLRASVSSTTSGLGSSTVSLGSGGTLQLDAVANTGTTGITGRYFNQPSNSNTLANMHFQLPAVATQTDPGVPNVIWTPANRPAGAQVGLLNGTTWESFGAQWVGKLNVTAAGPYSFFTNSDDATRVFIDGVQVNNNDGGKGNFEDGATAFLNNGLHDVRFEFLQGTGGGQAGLSWQGPGIAKAFIPATSLFTAENIAGGFADNNINVGNNVNVSGTGTIALGGSQFTAVQLGSLSLPAASTLNVTGAAGRQLRAGSTVLSGGTTTINSAVDVNPGQITDGGVATTLVKQGAGRLVLDNTSPSATGQSNILSVGTILEIQGGKLAYVGQNTTALPLLSTNPLGSASIKLNGGGLSLETKQGNYTLDNAITVSQNATIEQQASSGLVLTLGGTNGVAISGGSTLTFDLFGGSRNGAAQNSGQLTTGAALTVAGAITGSGNLAFRSTQTNMGSYPVWGLSTLTANNTVAGTTTLNGGFAFQAITNPLTVTLNSNGRLSGSTGIVLNAAQLTVDDTATVNTGRINTTTPAPVTLNSGTFNLLASTTVSSGETLGALTLGNGVNRVAIQNTPAASTTGLLTFASLTRSNRGFVQFQGSSLGAQATAASLVKFTTSPSAQLRGGGGAAATSTISVLPYAIGAGNPTGTPPTYMPVTYDATNGIRPINTTTEITALTSAVASSNARSSIAGATTTTGPATVGTLVNSYTLDNSAATAQTLTLDTNVLNFNGGAGLVLFTASNATQSALTIAAGLTGNGINFGATEGHFVVANTAGATIGVAIAGTNGITVSGTNNMNVNALQAASTFGGTLTLSGANTYTGVTTINGRLAISADTALGNTANGVNFGGGTLVLNAATTLPATRTVTMLANSFGVIDTATGNSAIAGQVTGSGGLIKIGGNTLTLSNATSNYSGPTTVFQGNLTTTTGPQGNILLSGNVSNLNFTQAAGGTYAGNISGLGSVTVNVTGAGQTVMLGDANDATKGVNTYAGGTTISSASTTLAGTTSSLVGGIVMNAATDAVTYNQNFNGTASTVVSGAGPVNKTGSGMVTLVNAATYSGVTNITGGGLSTSDASQLGNSSATNTVAISNNSTLRATSTYDLGATRTVAIGAGGATLDVTPDANAICPDPLLPHPTRLTVSGAVSGAAGNALTKTGMGTAALTASNAFAGATNVNGGTLDLAGANGALTATSAVNVSGGTLLLSGTAANKVNNTAPVALGGSGSGTTSRIAASGTVTETFGALTLTSGSGVRVIDMGSTASVLTFASIASSASTVALQVWNWSGTEIFGNGTDQLRITPGLLGANLALSDITFYQDNGITAYTNPTGFTSGNELAPIPEAGSVLTALLLLGSAGWRERRKFTRTRAAA